jgi:hypothetical protein
LGLFKDAEGQKFAEDLAAELTRRFPPRAMSGERNAEAKRAAALAKAIDHVGLASRAFRKEHKLGIFKQLAVSKHFQARLDALGYDEELIKAATLELVQALGGK